MDTRTNPARVNIERVRDELKATGVAALLVPTSDPHLSEYLPERWQARQWASGFTGSMATLVVTLERAALFADSRYWGQAERELQGSGVELVKIDSPAAAQHLEWLADNVASGATVAVDGSILGLASARQLRETLQRRGLAVRTDIDVFAKVWSDRPEAPTAPVYEHTGPEAPQSRAAKLAVVREAMRAAGASHHLVSTVDDIAWMLNLRGADVGYNPVFLAHFLVEAAGATLFVGPGKIDAALQARLAADGVVVAAYGEIFQSLGALPASAALLLDPKRTTLALSDSTPARKIEAINPSTLAKSRKSDAEASNVRQAMIEDGVALCQFQAWLESALADPTRAEPITELTIDARLTEFRAQRRGYVGPSFATIAAFNGNGAMPHYRATPASHAVIEGDGLLLIDSGAQYRGGTTDITRMWPVGQLSDAQRRDVTLVLRGTIALSRARFPRGTLSPMLDALARAPLWEHGLDYGHGTGHGVGYFLNVHEGPQTISRAQPDPSMAMQPGMITSVEPGLYRPGRWGVRVEHLVLAVTARAEAVEGEFGDFLEFETLTLCPIDSRCLALELLRGDEIDWLNAYHRVVAQRLAPLLEGEAAAWLQRRTAPL
ncbi:MAG: aminopeptidase P family protein [Pseudomonadota bacterium]|nr:aminopeptidase P family protein [Pseudomonadota bacterium]